MAADLAAGLLSTAAPSIQWYPGHIAKAERSLTDNLAKVDLVIEVRDARIPLATGHPRLQRWIGGKPHLLVLNRRDMVCPAARAQWDAWFRARGQTPWWCDARAGTGVKQLQQAAIRAGEALNARRSGRGMKPRPVRALMLGFPNVGKSALINRLVRQKVVESARRAGVTRSLRWVRLGQDLDLLDAPGVLPPRLDDQLAALRLALCDDIGQAAYDGEAVAMAFVQLLAGLEPVAAAGVAAGLLQRRYGVEVEPLGAGETSPEVCVDAVQPLQVPGGGGEGGLQAAAPQSPGSQSEAPQPEAPQPEALQRPALPNAAAWLEAAAARHTSGDTARMAQRLLDDFRRGVLGPIALELPVNGQVQPQP
ncbi:ribosome biogenesis GTPase YlqF [Vulcanococcus limneticus Candia 3F8]|uniref:ribosome biogenesis GTPase YlqF n=1 Tax=Vulcanococcus limneticus TaxID=2170428 RepID=UPI000B99870F|nr:ribosome biogenesis GTPase YlqF [Vulcanococcus limneticus]MCP9791249.1 ribosome biogenesis GTPase YlqF [Vulcanococcus limneticus MW73D5]MCP9893279.1 ribosome biogenesis GTPase YlqF [Vulcanococcus limneticus Candia 3F8]MCP9896704.1 ribosome biogenesis GTPase YlqF [Vulcanococcus limneticus Candia 3B3]